MSAAQPEPREAGHMTLWEHLAELRTRIIRCVIAISVGAVVGWLLYPHLLSFLLHPFCQVAPNGDCGLIATSPIDGLSLRIQMSAYTGLVIAMPVLLWQLWRFITPGLYPHEKKYAVPFTAAALVLFLSGAAVAYYSLNPALQFLISIGGSDIRPMYTGPNYLKLIMFMMIVFGAGFEFPVILVALQVAGVIKPAQLAKVRRQALIGILVVVAVITPSGDPISMLALAIPMYLFYEASILIGRYINRRKRKKTEKAEKAGAS
jgi:sec-independent protein translocase protein TatC